MKALVYTAPGQLELQEVPDPQPKSGEVIVRVRSAGICGSDKDGFLGRSVRRKPPLILGHEFSGDVVERTNGSSFRAGDPVIVYPIVGCGQCAWCHARKHHRCPLRKLFGMDVPGAFAEYVAVPEACLLALPASFHYREGALAEPLATAIHTVARLGDLRGKTVFVFGAGSIGLMSFFCARRAGAARLAVADRNQARLDNIRRWGADLTISVSGQDPVQALLAWTGGQGVDYSIDAVGDADCRRQAIEATATGGAIALVGMTNDVGPIPIRTVISREMDLRGCYAYCLADFEQAISLLGERLLPIQSFVSEVGLEDGPAVFHELTNPGSNRTKVLFSA